MSDTWLFFFGTFASFFVSWVFASAKIADPLMQPIRGFFERRWINKHAEPYSAEWSLYNESEEWNSKLAYLLSCVKCLGFWVSGVTTVLLSQVYGINHPLLTWLAMSGVIVVLGSLTTD
jgi:hypothetical protein